MKSGMDDTIKDVLREAPFSMRQLATEANLSYDVLRSWRSGRRSPSDMSARRLIGALEARARRLNDLAARLRRLVGGSG